MQENKDSVTLKLTKKGSSTPTVIQPGQFNMLYAFGIGEIPISLSGLADSGQTLLHTIRAVGKVSKALTRLTPGDTIGLRGPFGSHWPLSAAKNKHVLIIAGGIGLAPLRPILQLLQQRHSDYLSITALIGARTPIDLLYRHELRQWQKKHVLNLQMTVDYALTPWHDQIGVVTSLLPNAIVDPTNTLVMLCGPEIMLRFALQILLNEGIEAAQIYLSMERNMQCGVGWCGHCQWGPFFVCKDGPVFCYADIEPFVKKTAL